jgi:hypothetical protein
MNHRLHVREHGLSKLVLGREGFAALEAQSRSVVPWRYLKLKYFEGFASRFYLASAADNARDPRGSSFPTSCIDSLR